MELQRTRESNWNNLLYAVFAEEKDNQVKISAKEAVGDFMSQGAVMKKVEDRISGTFVGVEVYLQENIVYSKFRKNI